GRTFRRLRRRPGRGARPRGLPDPRADRARQAAGVPGQRRFGAEAAAGHLRDGPLHGNRLRQRPSRAVLPQRAGDGRLRGGARCRGPLPRRRRRPRGGVHPQRHRVDQPRRPQLRARRAAARPSGADQRDGAPRQHRALADAARRARRGAARLPRDGSGRDRPRRPLRQARGRQGRAGRGHAHEQRARHRHPGRAHRRTGARGRRPGAVRRQPSRGASARGRSGDRRRLLRLHRPQALRPDRHRRALGEGGAAGPHAAVPRRRGDDLLRYVREDRVGAGPGQVRGRHAAHRRGCRAARRHRLRLGHRDAGVRSARTPVGGPRHAAPVRRGRADGARPRPGPRRGVFLRAGQRAPARPFDAARPRRHRRARRAPLRRAAARALRAGGRHLPRELRPLHHGGGGGHARGGAHQGAGVLQL
ncbi:MAG: Cysteine desulfurase _ SufS, partial [uncultured Acetobacteraceae bacterium]